MVAVKYLLELWWKATLIHGKMIKSDCFAVENWRFYTILSKINLFAAQVVFRHFVKAKSFGDYQLLYTFTHKTESQYLWHYSSQWECLIAGITVIYMPTYAVSLFHSSYSYLLFVPVLRDFHEISMPMGMSRSTAECLNDLICMMNSDNWHAINSIFGLISLQTTINLTYKFELTYYLLKIPKIPSSCSW